MGDAAPGRHQVQLTGPGHALETQAVVVQDFALEQPGHGLQPDVRMWRHVHRLAGVERQRSVGVEKTPRPDRAVLPQR
jgi:hypothetical protein